MKIKSLIISFVATFASIFANAQEIDTISSIEAQKILLEQNGLVIIDARTPAEFAEGHVKGAINIDVNNTQVDEMLSKQINNPILFVYCRTNRRAGIEVKKLVSMNYKGHIYLMSDGFVGWSANKFPLEK